MSWPRQCFRLSEELLRSVSKEEVEATIAGMKELGICHAPYDEMDIVVTERIFMSHFLEKPEKIIPGRDNTTSVIFRYDFSKSAIIDILMNHLPIEVNGRTRLLGWMKLNDWLFMKGQKEPLRVTPERYHWMSYEFGIKLLDILIVLLATKNVVKETRECKTLRLGIGSRERHLYTTTLSIGRVTEHSSSESDDSNGESRRPHLRRGHVRRQHYGLRNEMSKSIWIDPVFVNADPAWIAERTAYNVGMRR